MNLAYALKQKNRVVSRIKELSDSLKNNNLYSKDAVSIVSTMLLEEELTKLKIELVALKAKIHRANAPVADKIYELAELKSTIALYKSLPVKEGRSNRYNSEEIMVAQIKANEVITIVNTLQAKIDSIQDELDVFNAKTLID
jgi:hypothetical protein